MGNTKKYICRICRNSEDNSPYTAKEMLHGTMTEFDYFQCKECGCLQINKIPTDLSQYYPDDYHAHKDYRRRTKNKLRKFVDSRRVRFEFTHTGLIGRLAAHLSPPLDYLEWLGFMNVRQNAQILDVGCGQGKLITRMLAGGYTDLTGIDPFISGNVVFNEHARIYKTDLSEYATLHAKNFDLVMLHHSFEHMENPLDVLKSCAHTLKDEGWLMIRIPLADSFAWEKYREDWYQLDAPRHLFLYTSKSMKIIAEAAGYDVIRETRDSCELQFMNSERYKTGIPGNAPQKLQNIFTKQQINEYIRLAHELNRKNKGDQGVFYLKKKVIPNESGPISD